MINTSNEYRNRVRRNRKFIPKADIVLADGTVLNLTKDDIMENGLRINDSVGEKVSIGTAVINKCTLILKNYNGKFNEYDFTGATIWPYTGLQLSETVEYLPKGVFTADNPNAKGSIITLESLDNMSKFDRLFSEAQCVFPCPAVTLLLAVCTHCGVSLATVSFLNSYYIIDERPGNDASSCREIVSWIAQLGGNFARCNINGALEIKWYDLSVFEEETNLDGGYFDETQVTFTESKSGTSVTSSETAKDSTAEITKIEGASSQVVTVQGKNLFDKNNATIGKYVNKDNGNLYTDASFSTSDYIPINPNQTYTKTGTYTFAFYNASKVYISGGQSATFTVPSNASYIIFSLLTSNIDTVQLELGSTATTYSSFIPNSPSPLYPSPIITPSNFNLTASQGNESNQVSVTQTLRRLSSTVFDSIEKVNGVTKYIQRVGVKSFTGAENWGKNNFRFQLANGIIGGVNTNLYANAKNVSCTHFMNHVNEDQLYSGAYDNAVGLFLQTGTTGYIGFVNKSITTVADFKAFLVAQNSAGNPVTVYYPLATPIETIIPDLTLTTYKGTTGIVSTANPQVSITAAFNETIGVQDKYYSGDNADGGNFIDCNSGDNYDGGNFTMQKRYHHIYSFSGNPTIGTDDIVITGVQVTDTSENPTTVLFGQTGYVLPIAENPLITNSVQATEISNSVGAKIVGMKFRQFSGNAQSDPSMEAGDVAFVTTKTGSYPILLTTLDYAIGNSELVSCGAETPAKQNYRATQEMKALVEAKKYTEKKLNAYDLAVQQMTSLIVHAFGLYKSSETLEDGSTIFYSHDKPTRAESSFVYKENSNGFFFSNDGGQTWNSGWDSEGNAVFNVLSAIGINAEWINVITSFTVGTNFSVDAEGKLKASDADISGKITATTGKIANMDIDNQGFVMDDTVVDKYFRWQVGETLMQFFDNYLDIFSQDLVKLHGTRYEILASDTGFNISYTNPGGGSCGITAQEGADGAVLFINASNSSGYKDENIFVNGIPVFEQLATALSTISTMQQAITQLAQRVTFIENNYDSTAD